ncbi:hypothetical protein GCM10007853_23670 [Algimonas ampicilliniresistens]|jgi:hypothetical protein|uniref:DUF5710 domain-containing protein n=1 Tax=Algimonas ampicilliniresistens TaxID=1298735 RepID=A0ABQ5VAN4_9PROT|nr:DUF5710 domain-containing protein [Algimonas ampicilliniresistens]GLQ24493.1 hypothetical protein GCM10007853_23670 [Algimonas ampicilliniresistens]
MTKRYINVAYKDREIAKRLGARWDASVKRWYCPPGSALAKVYSWRKPSGRDVSDPFGPEGMVSPSVAANSNIARSTQGGDQLSFLA